MDNEKRLYGERLLGLQSRLNAAITAEITMLLRDEHEPGKIKKSLLHIIEEEYNIK